MKYSLVIVGCLCLWPVCASSQTPPPAPPMAPGMQMPMPAPKPAPAQSPAPMKMTGMMDMTGPLDLSEARDGSGTSWLPDQTPMHAISKMSGPWHLMFHENVFVQYVKTGGDRGDDHFGSVNWFMGMAMRDVGKGQFTARAMLSLEPVTLGDCGYPNLLATGEFCDNKPIHDRQHPHDLFMEVAGRYRQAVSDSVAFELYGGPAAEPALGPTAFPHRTSAMANPLAPMEHHWLDSTHISFGVVTGGVYGRRWKAEASVFNGREPDQDRYGFDLDALDSRSARLWFLPNDQWALQVSAGHLEEAELAVIGGVRTDVNRVTASAVYHRKTSDDGMWASTVAWGRNSDLHHATQAVLGETEFSRGLHTWFARGGINEKTSEDLVVAGDEVFTVADAQIGYSRVFASKGWMTFSAGGAVSLAIVPDRLAGVYGRRTPAGLVVFLRVQPHVMSGMHDMMHMK